MKAITLRNLPPAVARFVEAKSRADGTSLNRTVIRLLEGCAGIGERHQGKRRVYQDLDRFVGIWNKKDADAFDKELARQRVIDPELWK